MGIDWNAFTPWSAVIGGVVIGLAAALLVLVNGRIAGISGIVGECCARAPGDLRWRLAFLAGLILAPLAYALVDALPPATIEAGYPVLIAAGLLVGIGTRLGGGCTSGHGVCGLSRLSPRSVIATLSFMAAGFVTVFVVRHAIGSLRPSMATFFAFVAGLIFGIGLIVAGMVNPAKILGFLDITGQWDPSLALVMVGAIAVGLVAFTLARRRTMSALGLPMRLPTASAIDARLVGGSLRVRDRVGARRVLSWPRDRRARRGLRQGSCVRCRHAYRHGRIRADPTRPERPSLEARVALARLRALDPCRGLRN